MATIEVGKYRQFFDIDEKYFPCIDDSAINAGAPWKNTYPHETFIDLLKNVETMLGGTTKRSVWIHGAYGTGKSQCAYALKKILEVPEEELKDYWNSYDALKNNNDLLNKLLGHKERGVITAYRYASGGITTPRDLYFAIQESVSKALADALAENKISYLGENTLKECVISWIKDHKDIFDILLKKPEWTATFAQSTADEVINVLEKSSDVKSLMDNIFKLADKEGITAMSIDGDMLKAWVKDILIKNDIKIVLVWDEFSGFFKQNRNSLDEFQKIVALCQEVPFYFIVVTHQTESIINSEDNSWKVIQQRFKFSLITLPDNIAFNLIGHAFNVKQAAESMWNICADDLNNRLSASRNAVMKAARITDPKVIKDIMPIHPMAALVLKNIATAFQSNQRSMFDFIKTQNDDDTKAFQWFIEQYGPDDDDHPLLTIDMLWDFFYEKGRDNLTPDIRMILDTYPQQKNLRKEQEIVLKTILIMQAIDKRLGGSIELFKATEQNLSYAFEGITAGLDTSCKGIAKDLADQGILVSMQIDNNKYAYGVAVLAGDQTKIDEYKKTVRQSSTTAKLASEGKLSTALSLTPALKLRYEVNPNTGDVIPVTCSDFTRIINVLKDKTSAWHFNAVLALAKDDEEAVNLRKLIKEAAKNTEYKNIIFIDALASPLGNDDFDAYVDYAAMSQYYQGNNNQSSRDNANKATQVLALGWKNRIYTGTFTLYYDGCSDGEKVVGGSAVGSVLQSIVTNKYSNVLDFNRGVTENQLKLTQSKPAARCGIVLKTAGVVLNAEKSTLSQVWNVENYWKEAATSGLPISVVKNEVETVIEDSFNKDGQVAIGEIYSVLENKYGFAPCNLTAFLLGFILKEYSSDPYRYTDISGSHENMSPDKLSEMIGNYIGKKPEDTYIVKMTLEEKAFYEVTEKAWSIGENSCSSVSQASIAVKKKMQALGLPVWCLKDVDSEGIYDFVDKYIQLVQKEGKDAHKIAFEIGKASLIKTSLAEQLKTLLTVKNCQEGMRLYLDEFENGKLRELALEIGATDSMIADVSQLFSVSYSSLWEKETGRDEIRKLITDYSFVKESNLILNSDSKSKDEAFDKWVEKLSFVTCSCESLKAKYSGLTEVFDFLLLVYQRRHILPDQMKSYTEKLIEQSLALQDYLNNEIGVFSEIYAPYLEDLSEENIKQLNQTQLLGIFKKSQTESNAIVKSIADDFRKNQTKTQMFDLWKTKTKSKNPIDWSEKYRTPILSLIDPKDYDNAKKAFEVLNRTNSTEKEFQTTLEFLENASFFDRLENQEVIDKAFESILEQYKVILTDYEKVRDSLEKLAIEPYEWNTHPQIKRKIAELAKAEYESGGSDKVVQRIENMDSFELKQHLINMIKNNINLGVEIMNGGK